MAAVTLHTIEVWRNKKKPTEYRTTHGTTTGVDLMGRMEVGIQVWAKSLGPDWELAAFSHTLLPFELEHQIE